MSSALRTVHRLTPVDKSIDGSGGDATFDTPTLDLRRINRILAIIVRGNSVGSQPDYRVYWYSGVVTAELDGVSTGQTDAFESATTHTPIVDTYPSGVDGEGNENWIFNPVPAILSPFVRFRILVKGGSPANSTFNLFAYVEDRL